MTGFVSLRPVEAHDLPIFFSHQLDPEATRLAAFPSRDREAFFTHWTTRIIGNPTAANSTILLDDRVAGYIGAWTDAETHERLICYWLGRDFWGRGIATAAVSQFLPSELVRPRCQTQLRLYPRTREGRFHSRRRRRVLPARRHA